MNRLPQALSDAELLELNGRAMRHAATTFSDMTGCRRRACRRNGCCGPMGKGGCLTLPDGRRIDDAHVPSCLIGVDSHILSSIEHHSRILLELLLHDPGYNLHSARLQRTFGKTSVTAGERHGAGVITPAIPEEDGGHHG